MQPVSIPIENERAFDCLCLLIGRLFKNNDFPKAVMIWQETLLSLRYTPKKTGFVESFSSFLYNQ